MDTTITLSNLITIGIWIGSLVGVYVALDRRVTKAESSIESLNAAYGKFEKDIIARLDKLNDKLDRLIDRNLK